MPPFSDISRLGTVSGIHLQDLLTPHFHPCSAISRLGSASELLATRRGLPVCERFLQWASLCSSGAPAAAAPAAAAAAPPAAGAHVLAFLD